MTLQGGNNLIYDAETECFGLHCVLNNPTIVSPRVTGPDLLSDYNSTYVFMTFSGDKN